MAMSTGALERIDPHRAPWYLRGVVAEHVKRYEFAAPFVAGKRVLDVACGTGYGSAVLARTAQSVVGVDLSPGAVAAAGAAYASPNLRFICTDAQRLPFDDDSFDMAVSFETIEHLPPAGVEAYLRELHRVLVPRGILLLSTPERDSYSLGGASGNPYHVREFTRAEFLAALDPFFEINGIYGQELSPRWQVRLMTALARGPWSRLVGRSWRAYKMLVASTAEVMPLSDNGRVLPMYLLAKYVNRKGITSS